jgi:tripartite-type tricarboxylate transporter receptor subunit TctC
MPRILAALIAFGIIASPAFAQDWPRRPITLVVPFDIGGSVDRLARGLAEFLPRQLGKPVTVVDRPGAAGQIGTTWFLHQPDDGYTLMVTPAMPYLPVNILVTGAKYTLDDFAFINAQWTDYTLLAVPKDKPYQTLADLIDAIKANPGKISVSVTFGSVGQVTTMALLDALGLPPTAVRVVTFDGGGATRTALAGGQVDFSIEQAEGADTIKPLIRPLAVFLDHRVDMFDAPPVNEALQPYHVAVPLLNGSIRALVAPAGFAVRHPQEYATLVAAYHKTLEMPEFKTWLAANRMGDDWAGPDRTREIMQQNFETLRKYQALLKN